MRSDGRQVVTFDGDDLRAIFGGGWGYERRDRVELAHVYFRLCAHLVDEGAVVVISAVAMFDEVRDWVRANIRDARIVYLDVPHEVRLERDGRTKHVYSTADVETLYDEPRRPDLRIANHGTTTPEEAARQIVALFGEGRVDG